MKVARRRTLLSMSRAALKALLLTACLCSGVAAGEPSDAEIRDQLIQQSIASYRGNCPCPYNVDRAGRHCGARSAYSKLGGAAVLCYSGDVSDEMVMRLRMR